MTNEQKLYEEILRRLQFGAAFEFYSYMLADNITFHLN
jgi:hypothetical protein